MAQGWNLSAQSRCAGGGLRICAGIALCIAGMAATQPRRAEAVTPESPEVRELIDRAFASLEDHQEKRLGGLCLIALASLKDGASPDSPHIQNAVSACRATSAAEARADDVYSNGLALILLCELDASKYREVISRFAAALLDRQKPVGAWGYDNKKTGDTSQTQYAALSIWELLQVGQSLSVDRVDACANWLLRTQDPSGAWGYQGQDPGTFELVKQKDVSLSMLVAGLGSSMIFGNVLGLTRSSAQLEAAEDTLVTPSALRRADLEPGRKKVLRSLKGSQVSRERLSSAISRGQAWYAQNFAYDKIGKSPFPCYVLYSLERYKSFEELRSGEVVDEPVWYQQGYKYLKAKEQRGGGWRGRSGRPCATAFGILFLLRSTQKSIKANLGQGTLIGGRGLSADLARMKMRRGRLVAEAKPTEIDKFLGLLDGDEGDALESLISDPAALQVSKVGPEEARRLQQLAKSGEPDARILAVRALSKMRNLDYVPTLIYAMSDPDKRVVREARDGLRSVSRKFSGFGLGDNFSDAERYNAIDKWKSWYRLVRPTSLPLP